MYWEGLGHFGSQEERIVNRGERGAPRLANRRMAILPQRIRLRQNSSSKNRSSSITPALRNLLTTAPGTERLAPLQLEANLYKPLIAPS